MKTSRLKAVLPLCCAVLLAIVEAACSSASAVDAPPASRAEAPVAADLAARIHAEIGDAACDTAQQCRTLAFGHKACGGAERYLPYSTKRSDSARLAEWAGQLARQRRDDDARSGMVSTCSVTPDPGATCTAGRCVLQANGPGGPAVR